MTARLTTPFGAESTAAVVIDGVDLTGRTALVTGGASGIGLETARALLSAGATVTLAVRDPDAAAPVIEQLERHAPASRVATSRLDLADLGSVSDFIARWQGSLDILVANAGVMALPELQRTPQGRELQFATNHLGHFALAVGLRGALAAAAEQHGQSRVVSVSSVGHIDGPADFDDLDFEHRAYTPWNSYGQSKTANILFAVAAGRRWADDGILTNALNPGRIPTTNLARHLPTIPGAASAPGTANSAGVSWKNAEQGAATSVLLAASPLVDGITGRYFEDVNEAEPHQPGIRRGVADFAIDPHNAERLWDVSLGLIR